jgi:hypothetical protein
MKGACVVLLALALAPQTPTPTPTTGTASIAGTVVDDQARAVPVRRAVVTVAGPGLVPSRSAITDDDGRFAIDRVPAGRFTISVSRASFVTSLYGAKRPGKPGTPIVVAAGQRVTGLVVKLWRGAVIAGVVRTEDGQPAEGLPVRVIAARQASEPSIFTLDNNGMKTNEAGEFRIFGLPPGSYLLSVTPTVLRGTSPTATSEAEMDAALAALRTRAAATTAGRPASALPPTSRPFAYAAIYFPGTASMSQATPITLAPGQIVEGVDLQLQRVSTASIGGIVTHPDGRGASSASIQIVEAPPPGYTLDTPLQATARTMPDGTFRIPAVSPGDYTLTARATPTGVATSGRGGGPALWGEMKLSVSGNDIGGLTLGLESGPALTGRVAFAEGALKPPADLTQWRVSLVTPASLTRRGPVMGSRVQLRTSDRAQRGWHVRDCRHSAGRSCSTTARRGPAGWWMRSMSIGDRDPLDRPSRLPGQSVDERRALDVRSAHRVVGHIAHPTGQPESTSRDRVLVRHGGSGREAGPSGASRR